MASVPATEMSSSSTGLETNTTLEMPSPEDLPPKITDIAPLGALAVGLVSPASTAVSDPQEKMPVAVNSKPLHPTASAVESDSNLEDGEIVEYHRPTTPDVGTNRGETTAMNDTSKRATRQSGDIGEETNDEEDGQVPVNPSAADTKMTDVDETPGQEQKEPFPIDIEKFPCAIQGATNSPEVDSSVDEEQCNEAADEAQIREVEEKEAIAEDDGDDFFGRDEDTAVELQRHKSAVVEPSRSVPPHMRLALKTLNAQQSSTIEARPHWLKPVPRAPRGYYPPAGQHPLDYGELQRTKAQLMKALSDLEVERKANTEMRKIVGAEKQASISAAMADMLSDLLQKQADALTAKAKTQEKDRDLQYREQRITQLETYLSNGQKQLKWQLEQQGIRTMSEVDEANLRREVELKMKHKFSDIEGKIRIQVERLRHQEAAQSIREQQYKALIQDTLENKIREQLASDMQAKISDVTVVQAAYRRGLAEGIESVVMKGSVAELKQEFLKGYAAAYHALTVLHNLRNGKIAVDNLETDFLFDLTHPDNPHNVGFEIGRMNAAAGKAETTVGVVSSRRSTEEGADKAADAQGNPKTLANSVAHRDRVQALCSDAGPSRSSQPLVDPEQVRPTQQARASSTQAREVQQVQQAHRDQQEQLTRSCVPPQSTFASELRCSSSTAATPNGTFASRPSPQVSPAAPRITDVTATGNLHRRGTVNEGVYAGRRTIRYENDFDDEPAVLNLIDLY